MRTSPSLSTGCSQAPCTGRWTRTELCFTCCAERSGTLVCRLARAVVIDAYLSTRSCARRPIPQPSRLAGPEGAHHPVHHISAASSVRTGVPSAGMRLCVFHPMSSSLTSTKHMQLISSASTRRAEELLAEFRDLTGGLPASLVSNGIRAQYVEALHISSCMTGSVRSHRPHVHEAVVEASLAGEDLDACLLLFIRRVLEEGARAEAAAPLIAPYILVYMRESVSSSDVAKPPLSFAPNEMQSARRQVFLSSMKAAIVGGGSVWLQCFYYTEHAVPPMRDESQHLSQTTAGYVLLRRRYAFTFIDTRLDSVKCFCRNPYESLALCIFQSNADAQTVRQNFLAHCEREGAGGAAMRCSVIQFVRDQSVRAVRQLDAGELALFGETLLPLIAHSAPDIHAMPQAGARLSSLCVGPAGFLRMVRDSVQHVEAVVKYLLQEIKSVGLLSLRQERNLWSETAAEQARRLEHGVTTVPAALQEVRLLVTAAWRDIESSEKSTVQNFVIAQLRCIAELSQRRKHRLAAAVQSMVSGTAAVARVTEFVGHGYLVAVNSSWLHAVSIPLHHISSALLMLEATLAADTLSELLQLDADPQAHLFKSNVQELMVASAIPMDPGPHLFIDKRPSSVSELIGALAKIADVKDLDQMQEWTPFNFQSFAYGQFVRPQGPLNPLPLIGSAQARIRFRPNEEHLCDEEETYVLDTDAEEIAYCLDPAQVYRAHDRAYGLHGALVSRFLRVYGSLGVCWRGRLGAVDAVAALLDEV